MSDPAESDVLGYTCVAMCVGGGEEGWSKGECEESGVPSSDQQPIKCDYPCAEFFGVGEK